MNMWVVSALGLLWITLLWTFECKCLSGHKFHFFGGVYPEVDLLSCTVTLQIVFQMPTPFYIPTLSRAPISSHPYQYLLLSVFWITGILVDIKWYFTVVLICISLKANDMENLFIFLTICMTSLENCLVKFHAHFLIFFLLLTFFCSLYIVDTMDLFSYF